MFERSVNSELVNMIMIENKNSGKVLVLDKKRSEWSGLTFPGGHVEKGESFYDSAVREAKEETGLTVENVKFCGIVHWGNPENGECYLEYLYKTNEYYGVPVGNDEGEVVWMSKDELVNSDKLSPNFDLYLPMFFEDKYSELFFIWNGRGYDSDPEYKRK